MVDFIHPLCVFIITLFVALWMIGVAKSLERIAAALDRKEPPHAE